MPVKPRKLSVKMVFEHGILNGGNAGFRCGHLAVSGGRAPYKLRMAKGPGDDWNHLFTIVPETASTFGLVTAVKWDVPPCPTFAPIMIRVRAVDALRRSTAVSLNVLQEPTP